MVQVFACRRSPKSVQVCYPVSAKASVPVSFGIIPLWLLQAIRTRTIFSLISSQFKQSVPPSAPSTCPSWSYPEGPSWSDPVSALSSFQKFRRILARCSPVSGLGCWFRQFSILFLIRRSPTFSILLMQKVLISVNKVHTYDSEELLVLKDTGSPLLLRWVHR